MTCEDRKDQWLLYVSDALEADEQLEMRGHLAGGCPECAGYLAEAEATFNAVPYALEPVLPPVGLKQRLMDRIELDRNETAERRMVPETDSSRLAPDSVPIRLFRWLIPAAIAASFTLVGTYAYMNQKVRQSSRQATDSRIEASASKMLLASVEDQLQAKAQVVEMLRSPDVKIVHLKATGEQPDAVANVISDQQKHRWLFLASGFKPSLPGQTYELWIIPPGGAPLPAGTFDVDAKGRAAVSVDLPKQSGEQDTAAVTNEVVGGVPAPKGKIQVAGMVE